MLFNSSITYFSLGENPWVSALVDSHINKSISRLPKLANLITSNSSPRVDKSNLKSPDSIILAFFVSIYTPKASGIEWHTR